MTRKRSKAATTNQVSLFPFLAVLICTMGVLIVLLVLVAKQADLEAADTRQAITTAQGEELHELRISVEDAEYRADELLNFRPMVVEEIQRNKNLRSHLERHRRELQDELNRLESMWQSLEEEDAKPNSELIAQVNGVQDELSDLRHKLAQARKETSRRRARTAVVAYDGRNGTLRRPIYIECKPDGIHLQPYGIKLTQSDFIEPILPGNPLDAAILAIREHWRKLDPSEIQGAPYPLILVRPGGSGGYAMARQAMKSWDSEFGHQVIPDSMELDFPDVDMQFSAELDLVIADALEKQERLNFPVTRLAGSSSGQEGDRLRWSGGSSGEGNGQNRSYAAAANGNPSELDQVPETLRATGRRGGFVSDGRNSSSLRSLRNTQSGSRDPSNGSSQTQARTASSGTADDRTSDVGYSSGGKDTGQQGGQGSSQQIRGSDTGISAPSQATGQPSSSNPASSKGENWALPTRTPGAVAYRRPIKVSCFENRLIVHGSQTERRNDVVLDYQSSIQPVLDPMIEAIWTRIDSWGVAGFNSYWQPELQITVYPGGDLAYAQLEKLLEDSGLGVRRVKP
ncbi:MAG: hypothetical protein ACON32_09580 [Pirellulaceae bacterium]